MTKQTLSLGLHWRKIDLHIHTPASHDFDHKDITPTAFVNAALKKGLDAIAITDHNSGEWIDRIVEAAKGKLIVFPGVEITATGGKEGGIHIIAIFDTDATTKTIENLLGALDIREDKYGEPDAFTKCSPNEVVEIVADRGGLPILAHADSTRGLLHDSKGEARTEVINNYKLAAAEVHDYNKYSNLLNGTDPNYRRKLAVYRASDNRSPSSSNNHSADGIGDRHTYFKIDEATLEALRQCFCDPDVRIRPDISTYTGDAQPYPRLISLTASQGFLGGQTIEFHEGLNSIIGGKGVGKSLVVEFVRFVLEQPSSIQSVHDDLLGKLHDQLGEGGRISAVIQLSSGQRVVIERTYDGADNLSEARYEDTQGPVRGKISELFPLLAYSQTEAIEIAKDESAQLNLIDSFIDHAAVTRQMANVRTRLFSLDKQLAESIGATFELASQQKELATVEEKIKQLDKTLASPRFGEVQELEPKTNYLSNLADNVRAVQDLLENFADSASGLQPPVVPEELKGDSSLEKTYSDIDKLVAEVRKVGSGLQKHADATAKVVDSASAKWQKVVDKKTAAYEKWLGEVGGDKRQLQSHRQKLQREAEQLRKEVKRLGNKADAADAIRAQRDGQLDLLERSANQLFELRKQEYDKISAQSGGRIRLELTQGGNRRKYFDSLSELKRGSRLREGDIQQIVENLAPRELVELVIGQDAKAISIKSGLDIAVVKRLVEALNSVEDFSEVLALQHQAYPEDDPNIQFRKDDGNYYDLVSLSMGQKCTALLIIALTEGKMPVIIDQPEDALDIPSIYQDVALQLRGHKDNRQFILTTHNPTVAVAADSDKFHVLKGTATSGQIMSQGAIEREEVRGQVIQHLEGGTESFTLKTRKYGMRSN
jgi:PHP family Zn ribbon phosphoesterase